MRDSQTLNRHWWTMPNFFKHRNSHYQKFTTFCLKIIKSKFLASFLIENPPFLYTEKVTNYKGVRSHCHQFLNIQHFRAISIFKSKNANSISINWDYEEEDWKNSLHLFSISVITIINREYLWSDCNCILHSLISEIVCHTHFKHYTNILLLSYQEFHIKIA